MIYIYEGTDLAGKTTLAKDHSNADDLPIIKKRLDIFKHTEKTFLKGANIELVTQMFFESIYPLGTYYDFILDRGLLSSLVYSKFFNRNVKIDYIYEYLFTKKVREISIYLITANKASLERRLKDRGEKIFTLSEILEIQDIYIAVSKKLNAEALTKIGMPIITYIENNDD